MPIGRPRGLAVVVGLVRRLQQEEDLDHALGCGRSSPGGTPGRRTAARRGRRRCPCVSIHSTSASPRLLVGDEQHEVHAAAVAAREQRRLGRAWAGRGGRSAGARAPAGRTSTGWPARRSPRRQSCMATSTSWPRPVALPLDQRQHQPHEGEAGRRLVALVAARPDRRDRVVVVAAAVQRAAERQADEVGAEPVGPRPVEAERRDRHHDQPRVRQRGAPRGRSRARPARGGARVEMKTSASASEARRARRGRRSCGSRDHAALVGVVVPEGQAVVGVDAGRGRTARWRGSAIPRAARP